MTFPPHKRLKLRLLLAEWPPTRTYASAKQVSQLVGFLMHIYFAVRPASFFVHRVLASVGMPRIAAGDHFAGRVANPGRRVALGPEVHADFEIWRWFVVDKGIDARGGVLSAMMHHLLERPAQRTLFSDASKTAVGEYCFETGVYWHYDLTAQDKLRFCGWIKSVRGVDDLSINVLERLGVVVSAFVLVCRSTGKRRENVLCCEETTRPPCIGYGGVGGCWTRVQVPSCVSSALSKCHFDGISRQRMCVVSTTLPPTVSLAGIAAPFLIICAQFVSTSRGMFENWGPSAFLSVLRCWPRTHATRRCGLD